MKLGRIAAAVAVAAIVGMWAFIFSRTGQEDPIDQLDDPSFGEAAQPLCESTMDVVEPTEPADTPAARADQIDEANARLRPLVAELSTLSPDTGPDADLVDEWLADWDTYLDDREAYVEALRARGADAEFLVTDRAGRQITVTMEHFAEINQMEACAPPGDV